MDDRRTDSVLCREESHRETSRHCAEGTHNPIHRCPRRGGRPGGGGEQRVQTATATAPTEPHLAKTLDQQTPSPRPKPRTRGHATSAAGEGMAPHPGRPSERPSAQHTARRAVPVMRPPQPLLTTVLADHGAGELNKRDGP